MGHFTITLPSKEIGDVSWGHVGKMTISFNFFKKKKPQPPFATGYIIKVRQQEYRLFKSSTGEWSTDPDGTETLNEDILLSIKNAILHKENEWSEN